MLKILLLQLFWLSFSLIGWVELRILQHRRTVFKRSRFLCFFRDANPFFKFFVYLVIGITSFGVIIIPGYIVNLPLVVLEIVYVAALIGSIAHVFLNRSVILQSLKQRAKGWNTKTIAPILLVILSLLIDYALYLRTGSSLSGDVSFHMAKVKGMALSGHLNLGDAFLGYNGIINLRYSTNILLGLQSMSAHLLHMSAFTSWLYATSFFRLIIWLSIFSLSWILLDKNYRDQWSYAVLILAPVFYGQTHDFQQVGVPHNIVIAWLILLVIGLIVWSRYKSYLLLMLGAVLVACTHTGSAAVASLFVGLYILFLLLAKTRLNELRPILVTLGILMVPNIINLAVVVRTTAFDNANFFNGEAAVSQPHVTWLQTLISRLHMSPSSVLLMTLIASLFFFLRGRIVNRYLKTFVFIAFSLVAILSDLIGWLALVGFAYIFWINKETKTRGLLVMLAVFYPVIIMNPIVLNYKNFSAIQWFVLRFNDLSVLAYITPLIGGMILVQQAVKYWYGISIKLNTFAALAIAVFFSCIGTALYTNYVKFNSLAYYSGSKTLGDSHYNEEFKIVHDMAGHLDGANFITDHFDFNLEIPAIANARPVAFPRSIGGPANIPLRQTCYNQLIKKLDENDLRAAQITKIITASGSDLSKLAAQQSFIKLDDEIDGYQVYSVMPTQEPSLTGHSKCLIPYRN